MDTNDVVEEYQDLRSVSTCVDIIPGILTEHEISYFVDTDFEALADVSDDIICSYINGYLRSEDANEIIASYFEKHMGLKLKRYWLNQRVQDEKTIEFINALTPESLVSQDAENYRIIIDKLQFLEDSYTSLVYTVLPRSKEMFQRFCSAIAEVIMRMYKDGTQPTYTDILTRIESNSFLFYQPNAKARLTGIDRVSRTKRVWTIALYGAKYLIYCADNNVDVSTRRRF